MSSTTFDAQLEVASRVAEDSPALYFEIQTLNEHGTDLGRANAARKPLKQANTEFLLQEFDLLAERRLCDAELFGGVREAAVIGDGNEIAQMPEFHVYRPDIDVALNIYWS